jgi:hypothetical protein
VQARDVYEEGIQTVTTVRDFSIVFDAYAQFEETMIASMMEKLDVAVCWCWNDGMVATVAMEDCWMEMVIHGLILAGWGCG